MIKETNGVYRVTARSAIADGIMFLLFVAGAGGLYAGFTNGPALWGAVAVGAACIAAGVLLLTVFKFRKLVAEVGEEGIRERTSKVSKGVIRWEEIASVSVYDCGMSNSLSRRGRRLAETDKMVGIYLVDPDAYAKKLNIVQKGIMKSGLGMGFAPINIPCNLLGDDAEAFVEICNSLGNKKA